MKKIFQSCSFLLFFLFGLVLYRFLAEQTPSASESIEFTSLKAYQGPYDDCALNSRLYFRDGDNLSECTKNYVHFYPNEQKRNSNLQTRSSQELKIGSFNLFHLGDQQAPMKNFEVMAKIIDQWDIVGVQELMPLAIEPATNNQALGDFLKDSQRQTHFPFENWSVTWPGYLRVLKELQKLDSSWSVILQSFPEGDATGGEMSGFFYRSSTAQLKEWDYCPFENTLNSLTNLNSKNYACLTQLDPTTKKLTSRVAFAAYFKSGSFDFIGLTTHNRFRAEKNMADVEAQKVEICKNHDFPAKCKIAKDDIGRYFEVLAVAQQIPLMKEKARDGDVIFTGDFNLELNRGSTELWKAALKPAPNLIPTQKESSTVGVKFSKMVSNYDHFILDPKETSECDVNSAKAFDFVKVAKENSSDIGKYLNKFLDLKERALWATSIQTNTESLVKFERSWSIETSVRPLNTNEKIEAAGKYAESMERMKVNDYALFLELISDHIPIEMTCRRDLIKTN